MQGKNPFANAGKEANPPFKDPTQHKEASEDDGPAGERAGDNRTPLLDCTNTRDSLQEGGAPAAQGAGKGSGQGSGKGVKDRQFAKGKCGKLLLTNNGVLTLILISLLQQCKTY